MKSKLFVLFFISVVLTGCNLGGIFETYIPTFQSPELGYYAGDIHFSVISRGCCKYVRFSSDNYRFDNILVVGGIFRNQWGNNGGTHCPTDAYTIMGRFVSPTRAEGMIRYGYDCRFGRWEKFVAETDQVD